MALGEGQIGLDVQQSVANAEAVESAALPVLPGELLRRAAVIGEARAGGSPVSFTSLALALFTSSDEFSRWLRRTGSDLMSRIQRVAGVGDDVMARARGLNGSNGQAPGGESVRTSASARRLMDVCGEIAREVGAAASSEHLFGAFCSGLVGHEEDLAAWSFSREGWTRRLLAWVAMRRVGQLGGWLERLDPDSEEWRWREWLRDTSYDEFGRRDAASVLEGLMFRTVAPNLGGLASARGWSPTVRSSKGTPSELELTGEVEHWLELARVMMWSPGRAPESEAVVDEALGQQALIAAAVAAPAESLPGVAAWFEARGSSLEDEGAYLWQWTDGDSRGWEDVREVWAEIAPPALAGFDNDAARGGVDRLGFRRDAAALAQLLAASEERGIRPPLSVGLFGDWGTGKTFFMDLLERTIDELKGSGEPAFCQRIVQIRFNAWHYMDANLWASLAVHLFGDLERQLSKGETAEQRAARVKQELASAQAERVRLDGERTALEKQLKTLRKLAADANQERRERRLALTDLRAVDVRAVLAGHPDLAEKLAQLDRVRSLPSVLRGFFGRYTVGFLVATLAALLAGLYVGSEVLAQVAAGATAIVSVVTGVIGMIRRVVPRSDDVIQLFADIEARARARPSDEEERIGREVAAADVRYQELVGACTRLATDVARLEAEAQQLGDRQNFARYVLQRSQSDDYRKQLGILSLLQRDFDELSRRLLVDDAGARVQRIVLYIDDLDRCPADVVVQVLQAVHLLLSFPLFVVVVAVDPTWVLRSLEEHYARQMGGDGVGRVPPATPHAYLEKIFQIPVRVRPMGEMAYRRLIASLAGRQVELEPADTAVRDMAEGDERDEFVEDGFMDARIDTDAEAEMERAERLAPPEPTGEALSLEGRELDYLKRLGSLVPTPRAAKRLVNVYRLIRVQLTPRERLRFVREGDGTYPAVLFFLALNARFPEEALALFDAIEGDGDADWMRVRQLARDVEGAGEEWTLLWADSLESAGPMAPAPMPPDPTQPSPLASDPMQGALVSLGWRQIAHAATLAARYSLPGVGSRRERGVGSV
jgi:hypothetical protein